MKQFWSALCLTAMLCAHVAHAEQAAATGPMPWEADVEIDIKGLRLGMLRSEFDAAVPNRRDFTVAGVQGAGGALSLMTTFRNDRLDSLSFIFDYQRFDQVLAAVQAKFPQLFCGLREPMRDQAGRTLGQVTCFLQGRTGRLSILKNGTGRSYRYSILSLTSNEAIAEAKRASDARKKDI